MHPFAAKAVLVTAFALLACTLAGCDAAHTQNASSAVSHDPDLEYLKAVNRLGPPQEQQLLLLLIARYANANRAEEGIAFIENLLKELGPGLSNQQRALYLAGLGVLRAGHASEITLVRRVGWTRDTIELLEESVRLSGGEDFVVRWMRGVVYSQLPGLFKRRETAVEDLNWCLANADRAPNAGWLREVYYRLASLYNDEGRSAKARELLQLSGYTSFEMPVLLTTPFSEDPATGHRFSEKRITEVIPNRLYALSGFEFTEYYFFLSDDRTQLVGIDAGTRPDSAEAAYAALREYAPALPPLRTILLTHAHWDHVGGHKYFRTLSPAVEFYARANYAEEIYREVNAPATFMRRFFGESFSLEDIRSFQPDIRLVERTTLEIGGTRVELIPVDGGETHDALLISLPEHAVLFVGDFVMPYLGAPFVEEGNLPGLLNAIDIVVALEPKHLLHGHEPLNRLFNRASTLAALKPHLSWLQQQVLGGIRRGEQRAMIQQANLIPPGLLKEDPAAHLPYLVMRENVINRIYDQHVGYWQPGLEGLDYLSHSDRGDLVVEYLGLSEQQIVGAAERMMADGRHELAAALLRWTGPRFAQSESMRRTQQLAYLRLMEKYQEYNPFKFIIYSDQAQQPVPQIDRAAARGAVDREAATPAGE